MTRTDARMVAEELCKLIDRRERSRKGIRLVGWHIIQSNRRDTPHQTQQQITLQKISTVTIPQ